MLALKVVHFGEEYHERDGVLSPLSGYLMSWPLIVGAANLDHLIR